MGDKNSYEEIAFGSLVLTLSKPEKYFAIGNLALLIVSFVSAAIFTGILLGHRSLLLSEKNSNGNNTIEKEDLIIEESTENIGNGTDFKNKANDSAAVKEKGGVEEKIIDYRRVFFDYIWNTRMNESKKQLAISKLGLYDFDGDNIDEVIVLWGDEDGDKRIEEVYGFNKKEYKIENLFSTMVKKFNFKLYVDQKNGDSIGIVKGTNDYEYIVHGEGYRLYRRKLDKDSTFAYQISEKYTGLDDAVSSRAKNSPSSWSPDAVQLFDVTMQEAETIDSIVKKGRTETSINMQDVWITASMDKEKAYAKWGDGYAKNSGISSSSSVKLERPLPDKGKWSMENVSSSKDKFCIEATFSGSFDYEGAGINTHGTDLTYVFDTCFIENNKGGYVRFKIYANEDSVLGSETYQVGLDGDTGLQIKVDGQEAWLNLSAGNNGEIYILEQNDYDTLLNCLLGGKDVECVLMMMPPITFKIKSDNFASVYDYVLHKDEPYNPDQSKLDLDKNRTKYIYDKLYDKLLDMNDLLEIAKIDTTDFPGGRSVNQMMINEIYARHGYVFGKDDLKEYFENKSWYSGTTDSMNDIEKSLSELEKNNITILRNADMTNANGVVFGN